MKIFISQSGSLSKAIAYILRTELPAMIPDLPTPFVSDTDIAKGRLWRDVINQELADTEVGIVCLTKQNLNNNWIHYEAGAISKSLNNTAYIWTLLIDISPGEVEGPLNGFQHTRILKEDFFALVTAIHDVHKQKSNTIAVERLKEFYDRNWRVFEEKVSTAIKLDEITSPPKISRANIQESLDELLTLTWGIAESLVTSPLGKNIRSELKKKLEDIVINKLINEASVSGVTLKSITVNTDDNSYVITVNSSSDNDRIENLLKAILRNIGIAGEIIFV